MGKKTKSPVRCVPGRLLPACPQGAIPDLGLPTLAERLVRRLRQEIAQLRLRRVVRGRCPAAATAGSHRHQRCLCLHPSRVRVPFLQMSSSLSASRGGRRRLRRSARSSFGRFAPAGSGAAARCQGQVCSIGSRAARGYCRGRRTPYCQSYGGSELISPFLPLAYRVSRSSTSLGRRYQVCLDAPFAGAPTPFATVDVPPLAAATPVARTEQWCQQKILNLSRFGV